MDFEPLRKVLELEKGRGYADSAVIGGLDAFLHHWAAKGAGSCKTPAELKCFRALKLEKSDYVSLDVAGRRRFVAGVFSFIEEAGRAGDTPPSKAAPKPPPSPKRAVKPLSEASLESPITVAGGISTAMAARFKKLGVATVRDLLYFFPHRHLDYSKRSHISELTEGEEQTILANVWQAGEVRLGGRRSTEAVVGDETGNIRVVWFNNPYMAKTLKVNDRLVLSGFVRLFGSRLVMESPQWEAVGDEDLVHTGRLVPLYPLTQGLHPRQVRKLMKGFIDLWADGVEDFLPPDLIKRCCLLPLSQAIAQAHYPDNEASKAMARVRLAFDELFLLQLGVLSKKRDWQEGRAGHAMAADEVVLQSFIGSLPFALTAAQQKALGELSADLGREKPMSRLLQGDVGSGKTVVAAAGLITAAACGCQGAFMAPTEILAEQHFRTLCRLLCAVEVGDGRAAFRMRYMKRPINLALLVGDAKLKCKQDLKAAVAAGEIDIVVGTHALIQKDVDFKSLGLVVVDEQHRFGVAQRSALRHKGFNPHVLVMTATPIPRTLALTLYGDLDISVIDELPPGRLMVKTKWLKPTQRQSAYRFISGQVADGHQAFIICPLVEESEAVQARAAVAEYERLKTQVFPELSLGLLHGRMSGEEKDEVMGRFHSGDYHILVSTPVVEVGIDVPNATVMLVDSADRFGLSQLHQFRGRVGRGEAQSYCMLLAQDPSDVGRQRLDIIEKVGDGFQLAEEDLSLRGPGEFFGTRQSGLPDLRMARLSDVALLEMARREATALFKRDPALGAADHRTLIKEMTRVWQRGGEWS